MLTEEQRAALEKIAAAAVECERTTRCPAELQVAQCILESGWLSHAPRNNAFGIKAARRHKDTQVLVTAEVVQGERMKVPQAFAAFDSLADAFVDHAQLVTTAGAYRTAWNQYLGDHDLEALVRGVARVYATDPGYAEKVLALTRLPEVQAAIARARGSGKVAQVA